MTTPNTFIFTKEEIEEYRDFKVEIDVVENEFKLFGTKRIVDPVYVFIRSIPIEMPQ